MVVFETNGQITSKDDKSNIVIPFTVNNNFNSLTIDFSYSPKNLEDKEKLTDIIKNALEKYSNGYYCGHPEQYIKYSTNLVTLSLDENGKFRGAAHRSSNKQHIVIGEDSTKGFLDRKIESGNWDIVLSVHLALCNIDYKIVVNGE